MAETGKIEDRPGVLQLTSHSVPLPSLLTLTQSHQQMNLRHSELAHQAPLL